MIAAIRANLTESGNADELPGGRYPRGLVNEQASRFGQGAPGVLGVVKDTHVAS